MKYLKKYITRIFPQIFLNHQSSKQNIKFLNVLKNKIKSKDVIIVTAYDKNYSKIGKLCEKSINIYCKNSNLEKKFFLFLTILKKSLTDILHGIKSS